MEWGKLNNDASENGKYGESDLKNSDVFKKQYAAVLKQLQEANDQVLIPMLLCVNVQSFAFMAKIIWKLLDQFIFAFAGFERFMSVEATQLV